MFRELILECFEIRRIVYNNKTLDNVTYPVLTLPVNEKSVFIHFKCTTIFNFNVVFFFRPTIKYAALQQYIGNWDLPIELKFLCHCDQLAVMFTLYS